MLLRSAVSFVGFSLAVFFIAHWMEVNGAAGAWNPAWQIIALLRLVFALVWGTAIATAVFSALLLAAMAARSEIQLRRKKLTEAAHEQELVAQARMRHEAHRLAEEQRKEAERSDAERRARLYQEHLRRSFEEKGNRSSEDAARAALDEF